MGQCTAQAPYVPLPPTPHAWMMPASRILGSIATAAQSAAARRTCILTSSVASRHASNADARATSSSIRRPAVPGGVHRLGLDVLAFEPERGDLLVLGLHLRREVRGVGLGLAELLGGCLDRLRRLLRLFRAAKMAAGRRLPPSNV